tara:strand:- start:7533 stop:7910 length:378 start_codon:yes stop_codon:yes gene_type:complete
MNQVELLRHVADNLESGKEAGAGLLYNESTSGSIDATSISLSNSGRYTLAPRTHKVNGIEVPAPLTEPPALGTTYFIASPLCDVYFNFTYWDGYKIDMRYLNRGLVHLTKEAAVQNAKAMIKQHE